MNTDRKARFDSILKKYANDIYRIAWLHTKNTMDAQDIVQEVFLRYSRAEKNFESDEHIKAWLIRVAINLCHDLRRNQKKENTAELNDNTVDSHDYFKEENPVSDAVSELPEKYRNVIFLFYFEGYSVKEIGELTESSEGAVKMQLSRARSILKNILKGVSDYAF